VKKFTAVLFSALVSSTSAYALSAGDLAFTSLNGQEDGWSMVTFVDIPASSTVFFTDNEFVSGALNGGESYHSWTTGPATITAGTVIRFSAVDNATNLAASVGTLSRATVSGSSNYGVSNGNEVIYAFEATSVTSTPSFITAVSSETVANTTTWLTGTGLTPGINSVSLGTTNFRQYNGARSGLESFSDYRALVNNPANWTVNVANAAAIPDTTAFTITPIPEASEISMMLAGLGLIGAIARRRNRA
jgi:hypothetical protein